jgi:hypothetical protein
VGSEETDFAQNPMFLGRLEMARGAVPLLISVSSVNPRHEWLPAKRIRRDVLRSARGEWFGLAIASSAVDPGRCTRGTSERIQAS